MRRRLLVLGLAAAAAVSIAPSASAAIEYTEPCGGKGVDTMCYHDYCGIAYCTRYDCHVWIGLFGDPNTAVCLGQPRPPM